MPTRKAIIIGNSGGYRSLHRLEGVSIDLDNYIMFLTSKAGGQWYPSEIIVLREPDASAVLNTIKEANEDYVFTAFSGHGFIQRDTNMDYVCLKDKDLSLRELVSPSSKQTLIIDSCRDIITHSLNEAIKLSARSILLDSRDRDTRKLFDEAIQGTPNGILVVHSTSPNEGAGDDDTKGGHFTYSFIKAGLDWWNNDSTSDILRVDVAVSEASKLMRRLFTTNQNPIIGGQTRRLTFPPFAFAKH